ncbi:MAG: Unknown protein [uncultured Campylobacterales bacterium]|uniref:NAD/FAD-dependent oxidoreductase n=1 Tax=uncultured Campylobacterales bacterium TaxID=352960 RepID=A0A6S6TBJ9_9BACT|nr:MAG: Unknown protein [uncultured Campylobacterales bacterium]
MNKSIAIIGAGLSGCNLYNKLSSTYDIKIFEKSRGTGGRCSTKYINNHQINHGTNKITPKSQEFIKFCEDLTSKNILQKQNNEYLPINAINKICKTLIHPNDLITNTRITRYAQENNKWTIYDENQKSHGSFDKLILTIPTPQILEMDIELPHDIKLDLQKVQYNAIGVIMLYSNKPFNINTSDYKYSSYKKFENFYVYTLHLNESISNKLSSKEDLQKYLPNIDSTIKVLYHLWKYALISSTINKDFFYEDNLGISSDYFGKSTNNSLENSYMSSSALAKKIEQ